MPPDSYPRTIVGAQVTLPSLIFERSCVADGRPCTKVVATAYGVVFGMRGGMHVRRLSVPIEGKCP